MNFRFAQVLASVFALSQPALAVELYSTDIPVSGLRTTLFGTRFQAELLETFDFGDGPIAVGDANMIMQDSHGEIELLALSLRADDLFVTLQSERGLNDLDAAAGPGLPSIGQRTRIPDIDQWDMFIDISIDYREGSRDGIIVQPPVGFEQDFRLATMSNEIGAPFGLFRVEDGIDFDTVVNATPLSLLPGDFDGNGVLDASDIDELTLRVLDPNIDVDPDRFRFDLDSDGSVNSVDRSFWVHELANTSFGDSNLDGEFNSSDLVLVFGVGVYEDETIANATWGSGDWNGDLDFGTGDLVVAFQSGRYEQGPSSVAVPEPSASVLFGCLIFFAGRIRRIFSRSAKNA